MNACNSRWSAGLRLVAVTAVACTGAVAGAPADSPPLRHLVYSFTYESRQHGAVSNEPGSSGPSSYNARLDDKGTIAVDVLREASDRGLVVVVSEQGEDGRTAPPATCAVYGDTSVVCDSSKPVNSEEYTLLRFLGVTFVDPDKIDSQQHWKVSRSSGGITVNADYTIKTNNDGVMTIGETRHVEDKSGGITTSDTETALDYDFNRLLPTSVDDYTTVEQHTESMERRTRPTRRR